jgi:large subunit ribosomal protein L6
MTKTIEKELEIKIPDGINISIENHVVNVKGEKGSISKLLSHPRIKIDVKANTVKLSFSNASHRREKALMGTFAAHIRNMIKGVSEGFEYKMKTVYSHFPIKTNVEGEHFIIHNFLGERAPRKAKILDQVKVEVNGDNVTVSGIDKEKVGQTVANIERATKISNRDIRVFQDGVYLVNS